MKYGFIGCGNMGGAIAKALSKATKDIVLTDRSGKAKQIVDFLECTYADTNTVVSSCERIFLAVKPQMMQDVLSPIADTLQQRKPLLITMAAGLTINKIQEFVGAPLPIIRIMPNTPVSVGCGVIPYCCNTLVEKNVLTDFLADMRFSGLWDAIPEHLMDAVSALSGSGPAYLYLMLEAMADGAVSCGIPRNKALLYAANTMLGAAKMQLETGEHPGVLKDAVCSPGGSTIAGIKALEEHGFRGAVIDCLISAYNRNQELGK